MLTGILAPDSGSVVVDNMNPLKNRMKYTKDIGVVFGQKTQLWWDLPIVDTFDLLKSIYSISNNDYKENLDVFNELLDLNSFINQPVRQLSLGQRMRADIAAALLHNPKCLFLDEPTIGLDVLAKDKIRKFIKYINSKKETTIIFTTHDLKDIEVSCSRVIMIDKGKIIYDGDTKEIKSISHNNKSITIYFEDESSKINEDIKNEHRFRNLIIDNEEDNKKVFRFNKEEIDSWDLMRYLSSKYKILDFTVEDSSIEDTVKAYYEKN